MLKPVPDDFLQRWPVSKRVNSSKADANDPTLIENDCVCTVGCIVIHRLRTSAGATFAVRTKMPTVALQVTVTDYAKWRPISIGTGQRERRPASRTKECSETWTTLMK